MDNIGVKALFLTGCILVGFSFAGMLIASNDKRKANELEAIFYKRVKAADELNEKLLLEKDRALRVLEEIEIVKDNLEKTKRSQDEILKRIEKIKTKKRHK